MIDKRMLLTVAFLGLASFSQVNAQTATNLPVLKGLAPVTVLGKSADGRAALAANFAVTGGIQTGVIRQPTLLPFTDQQHQALKDAFITDCDLAQLADGLGTTLGSAAESDSAPVPEPASVLLFASPALVILGRRSRRFSVAGRTMS